MARAPSGKRTHRRDRVARRFLYVVAGIALLVLLAPTMIAALPLRNSMVLARALPAEAGVLTAEGASFGWFTPASLKRVKLTDADGRVVFHAESIQLERSLLALLSDSKNLGTIRVERPALYCLARPDGSNLEDLLAKLTTEEAAEGQGGVGSDSSPMRMTIVVTGASIAVTDAMTGRTTIHDPINLTAVVDGELKSLDAVGAAHAAVVEAEQQVPVLPLAGQGNRRSGQFSAQFAPAATGANEASFKLSGFSIDALEPWLRRLDGSVQLAGLAEGQGAVSWWPPGPRGGTLDQPITSSGFLNIQNLRLTSALAGGDTIQSARVELPWRATGLAGGRLTVEQLGVRCDFASATLTGDFSPAELKAITAGDWTAPRSAKLDADIDLAHLARFAPNALHLQRGVAITSGRAQLSASAQPNGAGRQITGSLTTADLVGTRGGQAVRWENPIRLELAANESSGALAISRLACESSFLTGSVKGDLADLTGEANLDLDKLVAETGQLFDYGPWRLSGKASADGRLQRSGDGRFRTTGTAKVDGCVISYDDRPVVLERKLSVEFGADGQTDPATRAMSLASGSVNVVSGGDRLDAKLTQGVALSTGEWPLDFRIVGDAAAWLRRVKSLAPTNDALAEMQAAGAIDARAAGRFGAERVNVQQAQVIATDFKLSAPSVAIDEPRVEFNGDVAWDAATGDIASRAGQLVSSTVALRARELLVRGGAASGELAVRADLARLSGWLRPALGERRLAGQVTGGVRLAGNPQAGQGVAATVDLTAQQFVVTEPGPSGPSVLWQEPTLRLQGGLGHESAADRLTITGMTIASQNLTGVVSGRVDRLSTAPSPAINGSFDYDLAQLSPVIASLTGPGVSLAGRHQAKFELASVAGAPPAAHWSQRWRGRVEAPWTSASLYGLPVGQGVLAARLEGGLVRTEPMQLAVGGGGVNLRPVVQFDPPPAAWGLPPGEVATNVQISREVSDKMLKYIAPIVANSIRSEGTFSLRTDGVRAPLSQAEGGVAAMQTSGQLAIRNLRVTPGPGVSQWVSIARQIEALAKNRDPAALASRPAPTLLSISERTVNFQVARRRVYHQGLEFLVDNVPVSSSGSVGFDDESLDIVLSVPVQDRWIEGERHLVGLRGQVVALPVKGTLSRPNVDERQFRALSQQLLQSGIRGAVQEELGRAIEKLFD